MSDTSNIACLSDVKRSGVLKLKRLTYVCRVARPVHIVHNVTLTHNPRLTPLLQFTVEIFKLEGVTLCSLVVLPHWLLVVTFFRLSDMQIIYDVAVKARDIIHSQIHAEIIPSYTGKRVLYIFENYHVYKWPLKLRLFLTNLPRTEHFPVTGKFTKLDSDVFIWCQRHRGTVKTHDRPGH